MRYVFHLFFIYVMYAIACTDTCRVQVKLSIVMDLPSDISSQQNQYLDVQPTRSVDLRIVCKYYLG